jgi:hypothetical protein
MKFKQMYIAAKTIGLILAILAIPSFSAASGKVVKCAVESNGQPAFHGKCLFTREEGGSFSLSSADKSKTILEGITDVSVYITEKGVAEVQGLTTDGINSRWGQAKRSTKDRACWVGSDFKVCAW